jgi:hypothetical protein
VRTIVERLTKSDRTSKRRLDEFRMKQARLRAAEYRARVKQRRQLPARGKRLAETTDELIKAAKGLDKG